MPNHQRNEPRPKKAEIPPRDPVYVYHWERILAVIAVLVLLTGAGGYGLYAWLAADIPQPPVSEREMPSGAAPSSTTRPRPETLLESKPTAAPSAPPGPKAEPVHAEPSAQATPAANGLAASNPSPALAETAPPGVEVIDLQSATANQKPTQAPPPPALQPAPQLAAETTAPVDQAQEPAVGISGDQTVTEPSAGPFQLQDLRILVPQVKRFVLPRAVVNKEPQGEMSEIRLKPDGSAAVWCYSEVLDRRGSVLHYVWYHEGKRMARIRVNVRGNRWRSYSSKVINQRYQGVWRVELQDSAGQLLASAEFTLR